MADFKYEIIKHIGILSENTNGWNKELNLISWNGREPKYDIRDWSPEHDKMGKGITLTEDEIDELKLLLEVWDDEDAENGQNEIEQTPREIPVRGIGAKRALVELRSSKPSDNLARSRNGRNTSQKASLWTGK